MMNAFFTFRLLNANVAAILPWNGSTKQARKM